jgi:ribose transport system permease protein
MPPFIVTLAMMFIARGYAYILADGQSVHQIPASIQWLGRESAVLTFPNAVVLMFVLYLMAHVMMTRTILGRYLYAVGGNREAARLAGVPVQRVIWFAYAVCGLLAGVGGILMTSQYKSAEPSYGFSYELYVIAAVVVGGTSLSGGEGRIFNTLIGAFIIGVIQNGMNLMNVGPYLQMVVMGKIILAAVLFDRFKRGQWGSV